MGSYVDRAATDGVNLGGSVPLHRSGRRRSAPSLFFTDGFESKNPTPGPFNVPRLLNGAAFNLGLQLDLIKTNLQAAIASAAPLYSRTSIPQPAKR